METHVSDYLADPAHARARPGLLQWLVLALLILLLLVAGLFLALASRMEGIGKLRIVPTKMLPGTGRLAAPRAG